MTTELQAYFDKTLDHLMAQGKQAKSAKGGYCYKNSAGLTCAVGCHIPDGHPAQNCGSPFLFMSDQYPELAGVAWVDSDKGVDLASSLQVLHDEFANFSGKRFSNEAGEIAKKHNLTFHLRPGMHGYEELNGDGIDSGEIHD